MYKEYLGEGYHEKVRKKLSVDDKLLPNRIIDAEANIGAMKQLVAPVIDIMREHGKYVDNEKKYEQLQTAALHYLCGVLCNALKSRTSAPPYDTPEYKRNWDKKCEKFMRYANSQMMELMRMG